MNEPNLLWANKIDLPLKDFIKTHWKSQKQCANHLRIYASTLSQAIYGKRKLNHHDQQLFVDRGFDSTVFYHYIALLPEDNYEAVDDLRFVIGKLKDLLDSMSTQLDGQKMLNRNLSNDLSEAKRTITLLRKQIIHMSGNSMAFKGLRIILNDS